MENTVAAKEIKTLMYNEQIKMPTKFKYAPIIRVYTFRGSVERSRDNYERDLAQAISFGHSTAPCCLKEDSYLCSDYEGKAERMAKERRAFENAPELIDGEIVRIEGKLYKTKFLSSSVCDPIRFDKV